MTISKTENGYMATHLITWPNEEGEITNLERWEYRCNDLAQAKIEAQNYLQSRGIECEIELEGDIE